MIFVNVEKLMENWKHYSLLRMGLPSISVTHIVDTDEVY